jgi:hypothetical protein
MPSSLYAPAFVNALKAAGPAIALDAATMKVALFTNALSPNFVTDSNFASAPYTSNQVTSAGYTAGGNLIVSPTWVGSSSPNKITFDSDNPSWSGVTLTARNAIWYADGVSGKPVFYCCDFGADFTATAGTFLISLDAAGLFYITL